MLTERQIRFCEEYFIDFNGTQAAIRAGYSPNSANEIASQNLAKLSVQQYIQKKKEELRFKTEITQDQILEAYKRLAFYDPRAMYDKHGNLIPIPELDDTSAFALMGFDQEELFEWEGKKKRKVGYTKKVRMANRREALDSICRMLGMDAPKKIAQTDAAGNDVKTIPEQVADQIQKLLNGTGAASHSAELRETTEGTAS